MAKDRTTRGNWQRPASPLYLAPESLNQAEIPSGKVRDAVRVVFAGKKVRPEYSEPTPDVDEYERIKEARALPLEKLVKTKLTSFRRKDQFHTLDMISIGRLGC